jgi:PRC-barrel domain
MPETREQSTDEQPAAAPSPGEANAVDAIERTPPSSEETRHWLGFRLDDITGEAVGKVESNYVDTEDEQPRWLLVKLGLFGKHCLIPAADAVGGAGRVWVPYEREWIRQAPEARGGKPLDQETELGLCMYWGFAAADRAREIQDREAKAVSVRPAAGG